MNSWARNKLSNTDWWLLIYSSTITSMLQLIFHLQTHLFFFRNSAVFMGEGWFASMELHWESRFSFSNLALKLVNSLDFWGTNPAKTKPNTGMKWTLKLNMYFWKMLQTGKSFLSSASSPGRKEMMFATSAFAPLLSPLVQCYPQLFSWGFSQSFISPGIPYDSSTQVSSSCLPFPSQPPETLI